MTELSSTLQSGVTEELLLQAIERSGYPAQSVIADRINGVLEPTVGRVQIEEEWSFLDGETVRQLDLLVMKEVVGIRPSEPGGGKQGIPASMRRLLRYEVVLLAECKRSDMPFVFFLRPNLKNSRIPQVWGYPHEYIECEAEGSASRWLYKLEQAIFCESDFEGTPQVAVSVSKATRRGKQLELSGEEIYRGLTFPVMKAVEHFRQLTAPHDRRLYYDIRFLCPMVVIDAPMVGYRQDGSTGTIAPVDCVRLNVMQPNSESLWHPSNEQGAIDFVHIDAVEAYVERMMERADGLARRIDSIAQAVVTGTARFEAGKTGFAKFDNDVSVSSILRGTMGAKAEREWIRKRSIEVHS